MASHSHSSGMRPRRAGPERDLGTWIPVGFNTPELFLLPVFAPTFSTAWGAVLWRGGPQTPQGHSTHWHPPTGRSWRWVQALSPPPSLPRRTTHENGRFKCWGLRFGCRARGLVSICWKCRGAVGTACAAGGDPAGGEQALQPLHGGGGSTRCCPQAQDVAGFWLGHPHAPIPQAPGQLRMQGSSLAEQ